jgi:drug/metabolite transporter (DMT)-like permease
MNFVYKAAAEMRIPSINVIAVSTTAVFLLGFGANLVMGFEFQNPGLTALLVLGNGIFFLLGNVCKVEALRFIPTSLAFPLNKMNVLFVLLIAVSVFGERPAAIQLLGVAAACVMILTAGKGSSSCEYGSPHHFRGFTLALLAGALVAVSVSFGRVAARSSVSRLTYVMLSYGMVALFAHLYILRSGASPVYRRKVQSAEAVLCRRIKFTRACVGLGAVAGCLNFAGYLIILQAFSAGPLSLIHPLLSMSIIIPIALSVVCYHEKLTIRNVMAVALCFVAILLLHWK